MEKKEDKDGGPKEGQKGPEGTGSWSKVWSIGREQSMPDDAVLTKDGARDVCQVRDYEFVSNSPI